MMLTKSCGQDGGYPDTLTKEFFVRPYDASNVMPNHELGQLFFYQFHKSS